MATNKIGADKILSVYWFAILFLIASGIFAMVYVFYNSPFDVRNAEADALGNQIVSCISQNGKISSSWTTAKTSADLKTCQTPAECQKITGEKIVSIVNGMKGDLIPNIDSLVKQEGVAENFECLVLQIAMQESVLQHCKQTQQDGSTFYCDGNISEVKSLSNERETSLGVMQVNIKVHKNIQAEFFDKGVEYAVKEVLIKGYSSLSKDYTCNGKTYSGWKGALRNYNGWNTLCTDSSGKLIGNPNYVEEVLSKKTVIQQNFPEFCSEGKIVDVSQQKNLKDECHLNFNSESQDQYYFQIDFYDFKTFKISESNGKEIISSQPIATIFDGNVNLKSDCEVQETKDYQKQSKCFEKRFYAVDEKNNQYAIKITSVVRKTEKNAKK